MDALGDMFNEQPAAGAEDGDLDGLLTDAFATKKKKKAKTTKKKAAAEPEEGAEEATKAAVDPDVVEGGDYSYITLLDKAFQQIRAANPETERKKQTLPVPVLTRAGPRKSIWNNFKQTCDILQRGPEHLMSYICAELGTEASLDAQQQLVIRGKYMSKQAESLLKSYISEYVACSTCHNPTTTLSKDSVTRLVYLDCSTCGSKRSVTTIKSGFHATSRSDRKAAKMSKM